MRVAVLGAGGKVGREVCRLVEAAPDLTLAERIGTAATDGGQVGLDGARLEADVLIDFSSPAATMRLLDRLAGQPLAVVVGTTGFDSGQAGRLVREGERRPILVGANFTLGFAQFRAAALALAAALPEAAVTLGETYHALKKPAASGTTEGLMADLRAIDGAAAPRIEIRREGETPGINEFRFDLGASQIELRLTVRSRAAYAAGALAGARWLAARPSGFWRPSDMLADKELDP